jgi:hypothetical protein
MRTRTYISGSGGSVISPADEIRALEIYELALRLVEALGVEHMIGATPFREYRTETLTIHYFPKLGHLDVWARRKVLTVNRWHGSLQITRYAAEEDWEAELEAAAVAKSPGFSEVERARDDKRPPCGAVFIS